jgi:8-oxo-dGTP pyrophosphatase MutT (NUDIX family)
MSKKRKARQADLTQYAALPFATDASGTLRVLLVTSRETRRWVIPKGWPMKGRKPHKAAAREAFEEAGVVGKVAKRPIAAFDYWKRRETTFSLCRVDVFALAVERLEPQWPEQHERDRGWFDLATAASLVEEPGLQLILMKFAGPKSEPQPTRLVDMRPSTTGANEV